MEPPESLPPIPKVESATKDIVKKGKCTLKWGRRSEEGRNAEAKINNFGRQVRKITMNTTTNCREEDKRILRCYGDQNRTYNLFKCGHDLSVISMS